MKVAMFVTKVERVTAGTGVWVTAENGGGKPNITYECSLRAAPCIGDRVWVEVTAE